jgi:hypothetical protein
MFFPHCTHKSKPHYPYKLNNLVPCQSNDWHLWGFGGADRQSKRLSPLRSWVGFLLRTHVKRVGERSAKSRRFSPAAPVSSHRESCQGGLG